MNRAEITDPFHRDLFDAVQDMLSDRIEGLASGSAKQHEGEFATVAEKYAAQVAYIQALRDVLSYSEQIEIRRYGGKKNQEE